MTAAIASDQRALALASFLAAAIVVLIGAAAGLALAPKPLWVLSLVSFGVAAALLLSLYLAIISAKPSWFEFSGNVPGSWASDITDAKPFLHSLAEQCAHYHEMAEANRALMAENARTLNRAIMVAFWSLVLGGVFFLLTIFGPQIASALFRSGATMISV